MSGSWKQCYNHLVFAVKYRNAQIEESWETRLYNYMAGILRDHKHRCIAINGMPDHVHILLALHGDQGYSDMIRHVKGGSSRWVNKEGLSKGTFAWQAGYGFFSVDSGDYQALLHYINNQKEHHKKVRFQDEFPKLLERYRVEYEEEYLFHELE